MARQYTRKQLIKQPDEFITLSMRAWSYIQANLRNVLITIGVVIIILSGVWTWNYFFTTRSQKTTANLTRAIEIFSQPVVVGAKEHNSTDDNGIPRFKSLSEKLKASEDELTKVINNSSGSLSLVAQAIRGGIRYDEGRYQEAADDYQHFLDKNSFKPLQFVALEGLGHSYEALKKWDKALEAFKELGNTDSTKQYSAIYYQARVYMEKGDTKNAKELFQKVVDKSGSGPLIEKAKEYLAMLGVK